MQTASSVHLELADQVAEFYADPLGFVLFAYPWGEPGTKLVNYDGPDDNQKEFLVSLGEEVRKRGFNGRDPVMPIRMSESSGHGTGKALSNRTVIPTTRGMRSFGDIRVGDGVFSPTGYATVVTGVYEQGERECYNVIFDDGVIVEADGEHLWKVRGRQGRRTGSGWATLTTSELLKAGVQRKNGKTTARQWEIPNQEAVQFQYKHVALHPYTLGVWLGDGCRNQARISSADKEVIDRLREIGEEVTEHVQYAWGIKRLRTKLLDLGIADRYSYQKSVPVLYMENAPEVRAEVLRGLLDTDGECDKRQGSITFSSCSYVLAQDVIWLVRSLGGKAQLQPTVKRPSYRNEEGCKVPCRPCWRVTVAMPHGFKCFYIQRKQIRVKSFESRYLTRWIDRIEPIGKLPARCITVSDESKCFLANDFVVTHNSAMAGWITDWILSTRPDSMGTVTAGTATQLKERTWAAIQSWTKMCITAHWFNIMAEGIYHKSRPKTWKVVTQTCKPENAQSFAGQHAIDSTSWYLFDEASAVPDEIWTPAEQGMTDGEPMFFAWGQMERNTGRFHDVCFGEDSKKIWNHRRVDSRTSRFTNKEYIKEILETRGEDSDYAKVRVFGFAPSASELQFIDKKRIDQATKMPVSTMPDEPWICGVDVSGGGEAWNVCYFRKGMDGRTRKRIRMPGEAIRYDRGALVGKLADVLADQSSDNRVAAMFVDSAFGSPIVERLKSLGFGDRVHEINFGGESPDAHQYNMRAYMWYRVKEWLLKGAIPDDRDMKEKDRLSYQLALPGYHPHRQNNKLVLESKQDLMARKEKSPDDADALALTFARPVAIPRAKVRPYVGHGGPWS